MITDLLSNSQNVNVYDADGSLTDKIEWTGSPRTAISVCGTFITMLIKHSYGFTDAQYKTRTSPNAALYHDLIVGTKGFSKVGSVAQLLAGDIIAIKYPTPRSTS